MCRFDSFYAILIWRNVIFALWVTALINLVHVSVNKVRKPGKLEGPGPHWPVALYR